MKQNKLVRIIVKASAAVAVTVVSTMATLALTDSVAHARYQCGAAPEEWHC